MDDQIGDAAISKNKVKAKLYLGSEEFHFSGAMGLLSNQLVAMKEESMAILKQYIIKNNVPNDIPDESEESSSDGEDTVDIDQPPSEIPKKRK